MNNPHFNHRAVGAELTDHWFFAPREVFGLTDLEHMGSFCACILNTQTGTGLTLTSDWGFLNTQSTLVPTVDD